MFKLTVPSRRQQLIDADRRNLCVCMTLRVVRIVCLAVLLASRSLTQVDAQTAKPPGKQFVPEQGFDVAGHVVDGTGKPVLGATVRLATERLGITEPSVSTDAEGRFVLKNCRPGKSVVTVVASDLSPQLQELTVGEQKLPLEFKLEPGHTLLLRILDTDGRPIPGELQHRYLAAPALVLSGMSNADGRLALAGMPEDAVLCDIQDKNHMQIRQRPLCAENGEILVTMSPQLVISGVVVDAATGKPIPEFQIRVGQSSLARARSFGGPRSRTRTSMDFTRSRLRSRRRAMHCKSSQPKTDLLNHGYLKATKLRRISISKCSRAAGRPEL